MNLLVPFSLMVVGAALVCVWAYDKTHPRHPWLCPECNTVFTDRNPARLDCAIHEHRLAHRHVPDFVGEVGE